MRLGRFGLVAAALALAMPASAQELRRLTPDLGVLIGPSGNVVIARMQGGLLLVDTGRPADFPLISEAAEKAFALPVRSVIDTHWHLDHSGGNEGFRKAGVTVMAHRNVCIRRAVDQFMPAYDRTIPAAAPEALPDMLFDDGLTLFADHEVVSLIHVPAAHTDGDTIVRFAQANVIHMGDVYFHGIWPFIDTASGGSVEGLIRAVDQVLEMADAKTVIVPAHGAITDRAGLRRYRAMLVGVRDAVAARIARGETLEQVVAAKPAAAWRAGMQGDEDRFVGAVFESLKGVAVATPLVAPGGVCSG